MSINSYLIMENKLLQEKLKPLQESLKMLEEKEQEFGKKAKKQIKLIPILENPNRQKIIQILEKEKTPLNIREIWKKMGGEEGISYKSIYKNIQSLKQIGWVKLKKQPGFSGQAVLVEINKSQIEDTIKKVFILKKESLELNKKTKSLIDKFKDLNTP